MDKGNGERERWGTGMRGWKVREIKGREKRWTFDPSLWYTRHGLLHSIPSAIWHSESHLFFTVLQRINDQYKLNINCVATVIQFKAGSLLLVIFVSILLLLKTFTVIPVSSVRRRPKFLILVYSRCIVVSMSDRFVGFRSTKYAREWQLFPEVHTKRQSRLSRLTLEIQQQCEDQHAHESLRWRVKNTPHALTWIVSRRLQSNKQKQSTTLCSTNKLSQA